MQVSTVWEFQQGCLSVYLLNPVRPAVLLYCTYAWHCFNTTHPHMHTQELQRRSELSELRAQLSALQQNLSSKVEALDDAQGNYKGDTGGSGRDGRGSSTCFRHVLWPMLPMLNCD